MARNKTLWGAVLWMLLIAVFCLVTANTFNGFQRFPIPYKDKIVHFTFYFVLVLLWNTSLKHHDNKSKLRLYVFLGAVFYGVLIEIFQKLFTLTRSFDFTDILANTLGAFLGTLIVWLLNRNKE
ncbi:VanZ family protein [Flavobacterium beibuense]|uniref:VanZ family protein n=1 Tax=Flavobacterium beibuense TaxID=657326 RepID=A0A444WC00_9FLAO|nr:VanZ family protein [Flavobacterium beibuense]RYJ43342.1 VanZ family protein [Flavobacterium beibuense]